MERVIQIELVPRPEVGQPWRSRKYRVLFEGKEIGVWKDPECSAARYLLEKKLAAKSDALRSYRGDTPRLSGGIGWLAGHTVREDELTSPTFVKWRPFPVARSAPGTASDDLEVS
jgi:hypothetical protein